MLLFFIVAAIWSQIVLAALLTVLLYRTRGVCPRCGTFIWQGKVDTRGMEARTDRARPGAVGGGGPAPEANGATGPIPLRTVGEAVREAGRPVAPPMTASWHNEDQKITNVRPEGSS